MTTALALSLLLSQPTVATAAPPPAPDRWRHLGVHLGALPGLFVLDVQVDRFYAFASVGVAVQLLSGVGASSVGGCYLATFEESAVHRWTFEPCLNAVGVWNVSLGAGASALGAGLSAGVRYQHVDGFTVTFRVPFFGLAPGNVFAGRVVTTYLLGSLLSLPLVALGYRFP